MKNQTVKKNNENVVTGGAEWLRVVTGGPIDQTILIAGLNQG